MALYLGSKKVAVTNTAEKQVPSTKVFFEAGGKCSQSSATSFDGCWQYDDTANVTNMRYMFSSCSKIATVPQFDTSKVNDMGSMFYYCSRLTIVPRFDTSNVTNMAYMFYDCSSLEAIHMININANLDISASTKFTHEALLEIIGNLKAQTSGTKTLTMGSTNLAKLTDEDKAIATNKGWTLA